MGTDESFGDRHNRQVILALQAEIAELRSENEAVRALFCVLVENECGGSWEITKEQIEKMKLTDYVIVRQNNPIDFSVKFTVGEKVSIPDTPEGTL